MSKKASREAHQTTCPGCGSDRAKVVQRTVEFSEDGASGTFSDEITVCDECGEELYSYDQAVAHSRAYSAAVARSLGRFTDDRIRELRLQFGLPQTAMEKAFAIGPKTWGRWEKGTVPPGGPATGLMWVAEQYPSVFRELLAMRSLAREDRDVIAAIVPMGPMTAPIVMRNPEVVKTEAVEADVVPTKFTELRAVGGGEA